MSHTFSLIVPLYNCQVLIKQLLDNLISQTYKDFEVIFIDDCSKDETVNELQKYNDIINFEYRLLVNEENKGPGISRNLCIEQATGQYIFFLDSDDYLDTAALEKISRIITEQNAPDAVLFDYFMSFENKKIRRHTVHNLAEGFVSCENAIIYSTAATWCKTYRLDILKEHHLCFPDMRTKEDFVFNKIVLSFCNTIYYAKDPLYHYVINMTSVMNTTKLTGEANANKAFDIIEHQIDKKFHTAISILKTKEYLFGVIQSMVRMGKNRKEITAFINDYEARNPLWYKNSDVYQFDRFTTLILKLAQKRRALLITYIVLLKDIIKKHLTK